MWSRFLTGNRMGPGGIELGEREEYLSKRPRCDSHSRVYVSPIFVTFHPFPLTHPRPVLILWLFSLTFLALFTPPTIYLFVHTSLSSFRLKWLCIIFNVLFLSKHSLHSVEFSMMFNLTHLTEEPCTCHHHKSELRCYLLAACLSNDSQFQKLAPIHVTVTSWFLLF